MKQEKRNLVLIMTDQQRWDTIRAHGHDFMNTPGMDRLAARGVSFSRAYCPGATCVASRAAIFTGYYPHNTGVYGFNQWANRRNWIEDLAEHGYWCANVGKMHFIPMFAEGGYHERIVVENPTSPPTRMGLGEDAWGNHLKLHGVRRPIDRHASDPDWYTKHQAVPWELDEHLHSDVFIGDSAVGWIEGYERPEPFFLQIGLTGPHEPYDPLPRHLEAYAEAAVPDPVWKEGELKEKPPQQQAYQDYFRDANGEAAVDMEKAGLEDLRKMRRHYYAKISTVDEQVGKILDALDRRGLTEETVIVFCSDHGDMVGDHKLPYKWLMYEPVVRVPLIVVDPIEGEGGQTVEGNVSLIDLGPTLLDLAGLEVPEGLEGRSLRPALSAPETFPGQAYVYCENNYLTMIRDDAWKLVHYAGEAYGELYCLEDDPHELENLWEQPEHREVRDALKEKLFEWHLESAYRAAPYRNSEKRETPFYLREKTLRLQ